MIALFMSVV